MEITNKIDDVYYYNQIINKIIIKAKNKYKNDTHVWTQVLHWRSISQWKHTSERKPGGGKYYHILRSKAKFLLFSWKLESPKKPVNYTWKLRNQ